MSGLGKMLKDSPSTSLESQPVSAARAAVPVSRAGAKEDSSRRGFGYFIMLHNIHTVLSSRCQWQTTHPHSHPRPVTAGPDSSPIPLPWLHSLGPTELTLRGSTKGDDPPNRAEMQIRDLVFWKGQAPIFLWLPVFCNTVSCCALVGPGRPGHQATTGVISQSRYFLLRVEGRRIAASPRPGRGTTCQRVLMVLQEDLQQRTDTDVPEKQKTLQQLAMLIYMRVNLLLMELLVKEFSIKAFLSEK